jgi:hypothetical protein
VWFKNIAERIGKLKLGDQLIAGSLHSYS